MGLAVVCLLLAVFATFSTHACIPTKTPEPGIPATPGPPKPCPELTKWIYCGDKCAPVTITSTSVTCVDPTNQIDFRGDVPNTSGQIVDSLACKNGQWTLVKDGRTVLEWAGASGGKVTCLLP